MKEAMKLALEALEAERDNYQDWDGKDGAPEYIYEAITALREALAEQPAQQEPEIVQRVKRYAGKTLRTARNPNITARECIELANWIAAAPQPAQRKPLTDKEIWQLVDGTNGSVTAFARAIEAKLKEKNNA